MPHSDRQDGVQSATKRHLTRRYSATSSLLSAQSARGVITDLWSLFGRTIFRNPRPAWHISYLFAYCQLHAAPSVQVYWVDLHPLSDWISSNHAPVWLIYILYPGILYTCVIYLYIASSHSTATPSCNRSPWHIRMYSFCRRCHTEVSTARTAQFLYQVHEPSITCRFRISCFARLYIRDLAIVFWLLLPLLPSSVHEWGVVGRRSLGLLSELYPLLWPLCCYNALFGSMI